MSSERYPLPPHVQSIMSSPTMFTQLKSSVNLTCDAVGAPPLTYRWCRDGQLISGEIRPYLYKLEFSPYDRGIYSCKVINHEGRDDSAGILLTIKGV